MVPECRAPRRDGWADAAHHLFIPHLVLPPTLTIIGKVQEDGGGPVQSLRKTRLPALPRLELPPQVKQSLALSVGQQTQDAGYGLLLCCLALVPTGFDEEQGVARLNLADIMDQQHADHPVHIGTGFGIRRHGQGQHGEVPAMFG